MKISSRCVTRPVGGSLCIKIGYTEPSGFERQEGTSTLSESSRVFLGDLILDSDWLTKYRVFHARF